MALCQVAEIETVQARRISGPTPLRDLYESVQSELPERLRLRVGYLVDKLYTRSLATSELRELREFAVMTARVPVKLDPVPSPAARQLLQPRASSTFIDISACAKAGLVW